MTYTETLSMGQVSICYNNMRPWAKYSGQCCKALCSVCIRTQSVKHLQVVKQMWSIGGATDEELLNKDIVTEDSFLGLVMV